ncbi:MAG: quinol dehydrogenase ferredoxin subunit NapH [Acidobacteria bacterium]|nr:MAG: quinol dehydrogenase ferredoxin subunit NapH [Acidobacteriota bacterium]PIE91023.1 MAG: quinol dehydrogenase ferredoxin subunit NapH [Acidobacteriota bacterium]
MRHIRFLIFRRLFQVGLLAVFAAGNYYGITYLVRGNLSSSMFFDKIPLADPYATLQIFLAGHVVETSVLIGALIILVFYALFAGRAFCSWVCPINMVTDLAAWLHNKIGFGYLIKIPERTRYVILALSLVLSVLLGVAAFEWVSPIGIVQRSVILGVTGGWMIIASIFLFDLFIMKHGFCGHICPLGAFYALVGKKAILSVTFEAEKCTDCMKCHKTCPEPQVLHHILKVDKGFDGVRDSSCTNCGRCIEVCDDKALYFSAGLKK